MSSEGFSPRKKNIITAMLFVLIAGMFCYLFTGNGTPMVFSVAVCGDILVLFEIKRRLIDKNKTKEEKMFSTYDLVLDVLRFLILVMAILAVNVVAIMILFDI